METFNDLPLYYLSLKKDADKLNFISLVDKPAIESEVLLFSDAVRFQADKERRIIMGALLIPDMPIYRRDEKHGEYYVMFTKQAVEDIAIHLMKNKLQDAIDKQHTHELAEGVFFFEIFIADKSRGINPPEKFKDLKDGTLFGSAKVESDEIWNEYLKTGIFKGFSIDAVLSMAEEKFITHKPIISKDLSTYDKIKRILTK